MIHPIIKTEGPKFFTGKVTSWEKSISGITFYLDVVETEESFDVFATEENNEHVYCRIRKFCKLDVPDYGMFKEGDVYEYLTNSGTNSQLVQDLKDFYYGYIKRDINVDYSERMW